MASTSNPLRGIHLTPPVELTALLAMFKVTKGFLNYAFLLQEVLIQGSPLVYITQVVLNRVSVSTHKLSFFWHEILLNKNKKTRPLVKTSSTAFRIPLSFLHLREYLFSCTKFHNKIHFLFTQCL